MSTYTNSDWIIVEKEGVSQKVSLSRLHELTGARYIPYLDFADFRLLRKIVSLKKRKLEPERLWLSAYFKKEILGGHIPKMIQNLADRRIESCRKSTIANVASIDLIQPHLQSSICGALNPPIGQVLSHFGYAPSVSLRWINNKMGWGIFAEKEFEAMEFIAEYSGKVRTRKSNDSKNAYCFEYLLTPGEETPYLIDAQDQGGISRYINHHSKPNLFSTFTLVDSVPHIILYTAKAVKKGEELNYDYGPDYWKKRTKPC